MMKPGKRMDSPFTDFVVLDIENYRDGSVISICTMWREGYIVHTDWVTWWKWITTQALLDAKFSTIYAHNGGGWDWLSFLEILASRQVAYDSLSGVMSNTKLIYLNVFWHDIKFTFADTLHLFQCSLEKISQSLLGRGKLDLRGYPDHEAFYRVEPTKFREYQVTDCRLLFECLEKFTELVHNQIAPIGRCGFTLASTALKVFRTGFLDRPILTMGNSFRSDDLEKYCMNGYSGGRVEVFKPGYHREVWVYDVNSLYPFVMRDMNVPVDVAGYWTSRFTELMPGIYKVKWKQKASRRAVITQKGKSCYDGEGYLYTPEISLLIRKGAKVEIDSGYVFTRSDSIFSGYVDSLWNLRQQHKGGAMDLVAKLLMNSLYGKFGQKKTGESLFIETDHAKLMEKIAGIDTRDGKGIYPYYPGYGVYSEVDEISVEHRFPAIAGLITSAARCKLYNAIDGDTAYLDTDSIHSTKRRKDLESEGLGGWKLEKTGEGIYLGKKLYAIRGESETVRVKGIPSKQLGLTFDDLCGIWNNPDGVEYSFSVMTTARETFTGKKPCQQKKRKRRIKRTS